MAHLLESIYRYCPAWIQNLGISLGGVRYRNERLGGQFRQEVAAFQERDNWPAERMETYVTVQLREQLLRAFTDVPYYREAWRAAAITPSALESVTPHTLSMLPIVTKRELRLDPQRFVSERVRAREKLLTFLTSGSTGPPVQVICTAAARRRFYASREVRSFGWAGVSTRMPRATIAGRMVVPRANSRGPFHRYNYTERQLYFSTYHISPANVRDYVDVLNRYRPPLFTGYAFSFFLLATMMLQEGVLLGYAPKALVLSAEKLTPVMKDVIAQAFRARAFEEYSAVENCMLATECQHGSLHVSPDHGIIEIVDEGGLPVAPGREGRIVCTGLLNDAQPLIRYEIGDVGTWSDSTCPCGRDHLPVLKEVVGRLGDAVVAPDGRRMVRFGGVFAGLPHVLEGQVIQVELAKYRVKVVAIEGFGASDVESIRSRFHERLGPVEVQVERVSELERNGRGKLRAVISRVSAPEETQPYAVSGYRCKGQ